MESRFLKSTPLLAVIVASIVVASAGAIFILHFYYETPATASVGTNLYAVPLYTDPELTEVATTIVFAGYLPKNDPSMQSVSTQEYYLARSDSLAKSIFVGWTTDQLPEGMTITATFRPIGSAPEAAVDWPIGPVEDPFEDEMSIPPTTPVARVRWTLSGASLEEGTVNFDITLEGYEHQA